MLRSTDTPELLAQHPFPLSYSRMHILPYASLIGQISLGLLRGLCV